MPALEQSAEGSAPLRPWLPWLALGLVTGAMAPHALETVFACSWSTSFAWWICGLPLALIALVLDARWPWVARWLLFAAAGLLGGILGTSALRPTADPGSRLMAVEGSVSSVKWQGRSQGFAITPTRMLAPSGSPPPARLFVHASGLPGVACGDQVRARGVWSSERTAETLRAEALALGHRGATSAGWGRDHGESLAAVSLERLEQRESGARGWAWQAMERVRGHRELAEALIIGFGDPPEKPVFRQSGLLHILAVSGAHLAIAAALGAWLLRLVGIGWLTRQLALATLIVGYTWLTGASPATERAMVMGLAVVATGLMAREPHRLAAVSLAALALLLIDPANATDIGFQLSLAAVLGIVTLGTDLVRLRQRWAGLAPWPLDRPIWRSLLFATRTTLDGLAIGVAATLATLPLIAWHFGAVNPWAPLTTLAATPPATAALWLGLPCMGLGGGFPAGPWEGLYLGLEWSLSALAAVAEWGARLPGAMLATGAPSAWMLVAWPLLFLPLRDARELTLRVLGAGILLTMW